MCIVIDMVMFYANVVVVVVDDDDVDDDKMMIRKFMLAFHLRTLSSFLPRTEFQSRCSSTELVVTILRLNDFKL